MASFGLYGQVSATFWHSIAQFATITVVAGVVGAVFWFFLGDDDTENETVETDDPDAKLTIADLERRYGGSGPD